MVPETALFAEADLPALKLAYAGALAQSPKEPLRAAHKIEPRPGHAGYMAIHWPNDPTVAAELERLIGEVEEEEAEEVPSREQFAQKLFDTATAGFGMTHDVKLKYFELFAKVMGYIEKPSQTNVQVNNNVPTVFEVPARVANNDLEWVERAKEQQQRLALAANA